MTDKLKQFVTEHRQDFDTLEAPETIWTSVEAKLPGKSSWVKSKLGGKLGFLGFSASVITLLVATYLTLHSSEAPKAAAVQSNLIPAGITAPQASATVAPLNKAALPGSQGSASQSPKNNAPTINDSIGAGKKLQESPDTSGYAAGSTHNCVARPEQNSNTGATLLLSRLTSPPPSSDSLALAGKSPLATGRPAQKKGARSNPISTYSCTILNWPCELPAAFNYPDSANISGTLETSACSELLGHKYVVAVRLHALLEQPFVFTTKTAFANIRLVKPDGTQRPALALSDTQRGTVISKYIGNRFKTFYSGKFDVLLYFTGAAPGDKVVIDDLIEAVIK
jgi:hypothetical protein